MIKNANRLLPAVLLATAMFSAMGGPALAPALPAIKAAYVDIPDIEFLTKMLLTVSGIFSAIGAPLFGWLGDRFGRKRALIAALAVWGIAGSSGLIPQPFWSLFAARAALGLSLGGLLVANTAMIADSFNRARQRHMLGLQSAFSSGGVAVALLASGWLADCHWRWSFALFLAAFFVLPVACLLPAPAGHATGPAESGGMRRGFIAGVVLLIFFSFMSVMAFNIVPTQMPFIMQSQGVQSAGRLGLLLAVLPLSSALAGRFYSRISRQVRIWSFFGVIGVVMAVGFFLPVMFHAPAVLGLALIGIGFGLAMPHINFTLADIVPQALRGRAMGGVTSCKYLGQFFSPILMQPALKLGGYNFMLLFAGGMVLVSAVLVLAMGGSLRITRDD